MPCRDPPLRTWLGSGTYCSSRSRTSPWSLTSCSRSRTTTGGPSTAQRRRWGTCLHPNILEIRHKPYHLSIILHNYCTSTLLLSLVLKATSSHTKEDSSTEECNYEGEVPGPPRQTQTGGPSAAHGSQAGSLLPAELSLGESGQHRDLYSRGSD